MIRQFTWYGRPRGQGRPRFTTAGYRHAYKAKNDVKYEKSLRDAYLEAYPDAEPFNVPVRITIRVAVPIPKGTPKYKQNEMVNDLIVPTTKPDVDNVAKGVMDALSKGVAIEDDRLVYSLTVYKIYRPEGYVDVQIDDTTLMDFDGGVQWKFD